MGVDGQVTPAGYPDPELGLQESELDDPVKFPLTYHASNHRGVALTECEDEHCKNYVRSMTP